jgi:hypothetical protein
MLIGHLLIDGGFTGHLLTFYTQKCLGSKEKYPCHIPDINIIFAFVAEKE